MNTDKNVFSTRTPKWGMKSNRPVASPSLVGRVTPCAPRLPPARAKFRRRRLPDPLPIKTLLESIYSLGLNFFA
jgi:hypothetical protein